MTNFPVPPEGWRDRPDAGELRVAVARLAYLEAEVLRAEHRLRDAAPPAMTDEALRAFEDDAYDFLALLGALRGERDRRAAEVASLIYRWRREAR